MGLSSSLSAAAAAQRMHHHASIFRTASLLPLTALKNQLEASPTQNTSISYTNLTHPILSTNSPVPKPKSLLPPKRVLIIRHGQAQHNPRAEASREAGCSFDEFLKLMELDDTYDAELTSLGKKQAHATRDSFSLSDIKMVISSPLSRALQTADLIHPPSPSTRRVAIEHFREINGKLLNAQRRPRSDLEKRFPHWCFHEIPELDESWTDELETHEDCSERGYRGLLWVLKQPEESVLLVGHGGLLNHMMNGHENVVLVDGRQPNVDSESESRCITKRFGNCELREFIITAWDNSANQRDPVITLEEITLSMKA